MGFINFVIAILCWSCCRFVETTCMFLYLTVVQRTGSELEVVWFLMSDCISNQPALTTDLLSESDQTSPTETKINTVIGSIHQCGRHISEVIHTGWPVTVFLTTLHIQKKIVRHAKSHCWDNLSAVNSFSCSRKGTKWPTPLHHDYHQPELLIKGRMDPFFHDVVVALLVQGVNVVLSYFDYDNKLSMVALR